MSLDNGSPYTSIDSPVYGLFIYFITNAIVAVGVAASGYIPLCTRHPDATAAVSETVAGDFAAWDGVWYRSILTNGYTYDPSRMSSVAFFPLYPVSVWIVRALTGIHVEYAMLLTSHLFLMAAMVLFMKYVCVGRRNLAPQCRRFALLSLALFPTTFYMRMSYTESSFLFVSLLSMTAMLRGWSNLSIALLVGLMTSCRPVGVAMLFPFAWHIWTQDRHFGRFAKRAPGQLLLSCWGIAFYIIFQWHAFGEPFAFVKTQAHWIEVQDEIPLWRVAVAHLTFEPVWQVYVPGCDCYWGEDPPSLPLVSLQFLNPLIMVGTWIAVSMGTYRKILTPHETLFSFGLLAIPYFTHAYRCCAASEARYASVVFPFYIVLGYSLSRIPRVVSMLVLSAFAIYLGIFTAMFVSWYWFY